ncbi:MAG: PhzF family phenazine biosynthesis protein [Gammaproteobacteria bacterium]
MTILHYERWDVFTGQRFAGNPLAVVHDADGLDGGLMQAIANEFALPETTFLLTAAAPGCDTRLRIFTPRRELPMAGHPTIGATFALARARFIVPGTARIVVDLGIGPTLVGLDWGPGGLTAAWMRQRAPTFGPACTDVTAVAGVLGIAPGAILDAPAQVVSSGVALMFVPLRSRADVDAVSLDARGLTRLCAALDVAECPIYVFSLERGADDATTYSRMFAPGLGVPEDPATGGAGGPLGAYLARHFPSAIERGKAFVNLQGVRLGRPSRIHVRVGDAGDAGEVEVGGQAVRLGEGRLQL